MNIPSTQPGALAARKLVRNFGYQRFRFGRSKLRRLLAKFLRHEQLLQLQPGWKLALCLKNDRRQFSQDRVFWFHEEYEPPLQWAIQNLIPVGGTMVDVGANAGLMGFSAWYYRGAKVIFVEPHPKLVDQLQTNIDLNQASAEVIHMAASETTGSAEFVENPDNDAGHHLLEKGEDIAARNSYTVPVLRLEDVLTGRRIEKVDFLKSDTEGHDLSVLRGLGSYLTPEKLPVLYVETKNAEIVRLLQGKGYRCFQSEKVYIDDLRKMQRANNFSRLFRPANDERGEDCLWCARNSEVEHLLLRLFPA